MHPQRQIMVWLNLIGGVAVLGSYAHGLTTRPDASAALWGGVPPALQPFYTLSMLLAAAGYFLFTTFLLFRVSPDRLRIGGRLGYGWFNVLYALILFPSALWMPLTFRMVDQPSPALWAAIRLVLALVGLGSLGLLAALLRLTPRQPEVAHRLAVGGAILFCVQTALLDAVVWPAFFPDGT
jgi:hypothetical protein